MGDHLCIQGGFRGLCGLAARDENVFASFRSHPAMVAIIEHVAPEQGEQYLSLLRQHAPDLLAPKIIKLLQRFDAHGGGTPVDYGGGIQLTPNTLRYAWVHSRIRSHFGSQFAKDHASKDRTIKNRGWAKGWKICEIGGGYGGQAALTLSLEPGVRDYALYDQVEPARLAKRFLGDHPVLRPKEGRTTPTVRTIGTPEGGMGSVAAAAEDGGPCDLVPTPGKHSLKHPPGYHCFWFHLFDMCIR